MTLLSIWPLRALTTYLQVPHHYLDCHQSLTACLLLLLSWHLIYKTESKVTFQKCQLHYIPSYLRNIPETSRPIYYKMQRTSSVFPPSCALATWLFFLFAKNTKYWIPTWASVFALSLSSNFQQQVDSLSPDIIQGSMQMSPQKGLSRSYLNNYSHQLLLQSLLCFIALYWFILHCIFIL